MRHSDNNRVALITGAAGGLGEHFAKRLAEEGFKLVLTDLAVDQQLLDELKATGAEVVFKACDLSNSQQVTDFAADILEHFGRCDLVLNNAAYMPLVPFDELTLEEFRRFEAINVEAPFLFAKALSPMMKEQGWGRFIQIASSTIGTPMPGFSSYVTTKMAGVGMTRALAAEFANDGITCNAVCPGLTKTRSSEKHLPQALFDAVRETQLIKRTQLPEDLCGIVAFLSSEDSSFITGQTFFVDGGVNF